MSLPIFRFAPISAGVLLALSATAQAQTPPPAGAAPGGATLAPVTANAGADASAEGLTKPYAGGQVARGGRIGILGNQDNLSTPFSVTSFTNELIQNQQARSVGDVLQNDPSVRLTRGFGNFQETYYVRGFLLYSDDLGYNGLYDLLPRQYISSELFERVEVLHGASAFLNGASPSGVAIGGSINLLPKRAGNEDLNQVTAGFSSGAQYRLGADVSRRFGPDNSTGIRVNLGRRSGGTGINGESVDLSVASIGLDWRSANARLSADFGHQEHQLKGTRTNVQLGAVSTLPKAPDAKTNWAQPWSYSDERDSWGSLRGEYDIGQNVTVWAAGGFRQSRENNSLANIQVDYATTGAGATYRFDNAREDAVNTGEIGIRAKTRTGPIKHELVAHASTFYKDSRNAFGLSAFNGLATNLYNASPLAQPAITFAGGDLNRPGTTAVTRLTSFAIGDTMSMFDDSLLLTLGVRHQKMVYQEFGYGTAVEGSYYNQSRNSPLLGLVYRLNKQFSVYGNYVEGLSKGDTAPSTVVNLGTSLAPFVAKQKEIGVKFDGGRIGAGLAAFSTNRPRGIVNAANVFTSSGEDRHQGLEATVYGEPIRGVRVLGGVTLLDAEQRSTGSATTDGRKVIGVPRTQVSLGTELDVPGVQGLSLDARMLYTSKVYANDTNSIEVPSWTRFDLGARYMMALGGKLVTFRGRIDNVANRSYWGSTGGYPGIGYLTLANPRTFTLSASIEM